MTWALSLLGLATIGILVYIAYLYGRQVGTYRAARREWQADVEQARRAYAASRYQAGPLDLDDGFAVRVRDRRAGADLPGRGAAPADHRGDAQP